MDGTTADVPAMVSRTARVLRDAAGALEAFGAAHERWRATQPPDEADAQAGDEPPGGM